ncbi:flagellar hook-associated protein FlgL [Acidocella facilis]|uniref:flagellar hook-associated protein FlgL n=1 Tax=Acidocella facilis TaxID=525 RepID=UPI000479DDDE|nr:flagellar hook-associated protein FlgL [Acidocella facilis]
MDLSLYTNFSNSLAKQESQISLLQQEISTGLAVQTPDQNPAAYAAAAIGQDQVASLASDNTNQAAIQSQLGTVSDTYGSVSALLNSVQSVVEQALNATTNPQDMASLATQVQVDQQQMLSLANTQGTSGSYVFAGTRGSIEPFQRDPTTGQIIYLGDGGSSQASISPSAQASAVTNGEVFVSGLSGDGTASIAAASSNTGTATLISEGVANSAQASAFQQGSGNITIAFAQGTSGMTYSATDASGNVVASGTVSSAADSTTSIQVAGSSYQIQGNPAAGDSFTLSPSRPQSVFTLLQNLVSTLSTAGSGAAGAAQTRQALNQSLAGLAQYQSDVLTAQAQTGVTLQAVQTASTSNATASATIQTADNAATAVDMPTALTNLDQSMTAMEAAMKSFAAVQGLSLFQYL